MMDIITNIYREDGKIFCEVPIINLEISCDFITVTELADMRVKVSVHDCDIDNCETDVHFKTRKADLRINTEGLSEIRANDKKTYWKINWGYKKV